MAQINTLLSQRTRSEFGAYAKATGLDAAELARLLIVREMRVRKILSLGSPNVKNANKNNRARRGVPRKLTAHFHRKKDVVDFDRYAQQAALSRSAAAKLIFETELKEKWLLRAF
jgi:hypothetical protein